MPEMSNKSGERLELGIYIGKRDHRGEAGTGRTHEQRELVHEIAQGGLAARSTHVQLHRKAGLFDVQLVAEIGKLFRFRFVYVSSTGAHFEKATELFNSAVKIPLESDIAVDLIRYFRARSIWNSSEFRTLAKADLLFFNEAKSRFADDRFEMLFKNWKAGRITEAELRAEFPSKVPNRKVYFETYLVPKHPDFRARDDESG